jgi:hypothetical protein
MERKGKIILILMAASGKNKLPLRLLTGFTVLFLILAGSPFFLNIQNNADAQSNPYAGGPSIENITNSGPTSSGSFIFWNSNASSNNRVFYGLNEIDVNNFVNGLFSQWHNNTFYPIIRLSGLSANTTYYYKPESMYFDSINDSVPAKSFITLRPGVWTSPAEYMVSPPGWMATPVDKFRNVNITAAILDSNGRYISGLSPLEAIIYNSTGGEIGRTALTGTGPYTGEFVLDTYQNEGGYVVRITGYPDIAGEFSVLEWGCANCHSAGGSNYPSTFDSGTVHPKHFDTTQINLIHCADDNCQTDTTYTTTSVCGDCHSLMYPTWVAHPRSGACSECHITPSGGNATLACENCHADITTGQTVLSPRYGQDKHKNYPCTDCHGTLTSLTTKPNCTNCHPRSGSILFGKPIPDSIENTSHSLSQTVPCGLCHNREHDLKSLNTLDVTVCRTCHPGITHDGGNQCTTCHGGDPHKVTFAGGTDCKGCHGYNYTGANPIAKTTLVDINAFNDSIHQNINNSVPDGSVTNDDCWRCHYLQDMNRQNIRKCNFCHKKPAQWHGNANITSNLTILSGS